MNDDRFSALLRAGMPPVGEDAPPPDLWRAIEARVDEPPRWSLVDLGLAAVVAALLLMNPEWLWLLAYHL